MSTYTVHQGKALSCHALGWAEQFATNEMIAQRLRDAGFTEVSVNGNGHSREATALWSHKDATAQIPSQVSSIQELEVWGSSAALKPPRSRRQGQLSARCRRRRAP